MSILLRRTQVDMSHSYSRERGRDLDRSSREHAPIRDRSPKRKDASSRPVFGRNKVLPKGMYFFLR